MPPTTTFFKALVQQWPFSEHDPATVDNMTRGVSKIPRLVTSVLAIFGSWGTAGVATPTAANGLIVDAAPDSVQPYVLPNLKGAAVDFGGLIIRTLVSNATSSGTMSIVGVNSGPAALNLIHNHQEFETFYALKGSVQVFHNADQGRLVQANDFVLLSPKNNHTYRPNDLDFQLSLCMAPGGIDGFFAAAGDPYKSSAPFNSQDQSQLNVTKVLGLMPQYNIVPEPYNSINLDWTNGTTTDGLATWHVANQTLPTDATKPYFISSNRGPKYLQRTQQKVIARLASANQTAGKLSMATIAMAPCKKPSSAVSYDVHQAFQVTEGQLHLEIYNQTVPMIFGDLAFIPKGTPFRYWSTVGFTKFITWAAGPEGLADHLIEGAEQWDYAVWPV
jgi:mannose-6-phosphate isomerase-like protein (cupin superfamily)